jgi:hypothetical protein
VVGDHQVGAPLHRLLHHRLREVIGQQDGADRAQGRGLGDGEAGGAPPHLEQKADIVPGLGEGGGGERLQLGQDALQLHRAEGPGGVQTPQHAHLCGGGTLGTGTTGAIE